MKFHSFTVLIGYAHQRAPTMNSLSLLLLLVMVSAGRAFVAKVAPKSATSLNDTFGGKMFDPSQNPLSRGGKNAWEFEYDTMYVEEPKPKKQVVVKPKKAPKQVKTVSKAYGAVAQNAAKKAPSKKQPTSPFLSVLAKKQAAPAEPPKPKNPILSLFQK